MLGAGGELQIVGAGRELHPERVRGRAIPGRTCRRSSGSGNVGRRLGGLRGKRTEEGTWPSSGFIVNKRYYDPKAWSMILP